MVVFVLDINAFALRGVFAVTARRGINDASDCLLLATTSVPATVNPDTDTMVAAFNAIEEMATACTLDTSRSISIEYYPTSDNMSSE
mmetsp:Transcript_4996/g.9752  ORF Transcript_4996/g.9752 Transcript_4996/m.9752 type:complete len:87 (+) Transcript_4996:1516-1776(+)